nr:hypothetical protein [uncultured Oscillibacter sp.]
MNRPRKPAVYQRSILGIANRSALARLTSRLRELGQRSSEIHSLAQKGTRADCREAVHLIEGISAETLLADRSYDTNAILSYTSSAGIETVISPKKNRKKQRQCDEYLCKLRHLVENCFLVLRRWSGIATRCAKISDAFIAAVQIRCIAIWAAIRA